MTTTRRHLLIGGGAAAVTATLGAAVLLRSPGALPPGVNTLVLHSAATPPARFVSLLRRETLPGAMATHRIALLARSGFDAGSGLLDRADGARVVALVDDAHALVLEHLLTARGATGLQRRHSGDAVLIVATL